MTKVFSKTKMLTDVPMHYCPGCTHGIAHRLIAEVLEEIGAEGHCVGIAPVGCAVFAYNYFNCDMLEASHGRAPAVATGVKRVNPSNIVFAYQGDGDLASIGMAEIIHAATRGEKITIIFINNAIYGMTGGQMAPTTLVGQKATPCVYGRDPSVNGNPIKVCELLATLTGPTFIERASLCDVKHIVAAKKAIRKAFQHQIDGKGFSFVELLSTCPTNWHMTPEQSLNYVKNDMEALFPLGTFKEVE
ncbi:MAG: thiamine pyrophosphate-dependent enzyme [Clostridia bacterium]